MIELPFPAKILWPNGRGHWAAKARAFKQHKMWAYIVTSASTARVGTGRIKWSVVMFPKTAHAIDDDNARASLKAYQDGIAQALGVDDSRFDAPTLTFGKPFKGGLVSIVIEQGT